MMMVLVGSDVVDGLVSLSATRGVLVGRGCSRLFLRARSCSHGAAGGSEGLDNGGEEGVSDSEEHNMIISTYTGNMQMGCVYATMCTMLLEGRNCWSHSINNLRYWSLETLNILPWCNAQHSNGGSSRHSARMTYRPSAALQLLGSLRMSHNKYLCANK